MVNELQSALYECRVMHHRFAPKVHHFDYRVFYLWMDLDELDVLSTNLTCFSRNRFNLFSFFDRDHLDLGAGNVKANLLKWLQTQGVDTSPIRAVRLLAFPRVLGHIFNPVSFFYCFDEKDAPLWVVAQVTNTFREQKPYLIRDQAKDGRFRRVTRKFFYVSPFAELEQSFDFKLGVPGEKLAIQIDNRDGGERLLASTLAGVRRPLTNGRLFWFALKYPLLTLRVIFLIHWHAFLLWMQRVPYYRKAANPGLQRDLFKPHRSIASNHPPGTQ
jgi:uncharacterized protein